MQVSASQSLYRNFEQQPQNKSTRYLNKTSIFVSQQRLQTFWFSFSAVIKHKQNSLISCTHFYYGNIHLYFNPIDMISLMYADNYYLCQYPIIAITDNLCKPILTSVFIIHRYVRDDGFIFITLHPSNRTV